ncbi:hypothetical protein Tco_0452056 [Tanacetum coccineum]
MAEQDIPPPTITAMKIPIIRKGEYDIWSMRMRQYICHTDHNLWDVIVNGDLEEEPAPTGETSAPPAPKTAKQLEVYNCIMGFNPLVHSFRALSTLRRSGLRTASAAAKPCQEDSLEFYLITGSIYTDKRGTVDYIMMEMHIPLSSRVKFIATCSYLRLNDLITSRKNNPKLSQTLKSTSSSRQSIKLIPYEVLKLKNIKQDGYTHFQRQEQYEHVGPEVTRSQEGKRSQDDDKRLCLVDDLKEVLNHIHIKYGYCKNSQENGQNRTNSDTGKEREYKSRENAIKGQPKSTLGQHGQH